MVRFLDFSSTTDTAARSIFSEYLVARSAAYKPVAIALKSPLTLTQAVDELNDGLGPEDFDAPLWRSWSSSKDRYFVVGSVTSDTVKLHPIGGRVRQNSWASSFFGHFKAVANGCELRGVITPRQRGLRWFMRVWITFTSLYFLINAADWLGTLLGGHPGSVRYFQQAGTGLFALLFGLALEFTGQRWARQRADWLQLWLEDQLRAHEISP